MGPGQRWTETLYDAYGQSIRVDEILFEQHSAHQHLLIFRNQLFGTVLVLDGVVQTTEKDEFIYHEMMTHVPLLAHGNARRVLIIGGGDGGILREVCRHQGVGHITQVEIDPTVIELSKQYLPNHSAGAFADSRLNLVIGDGYRFVQECEERYDVIISDSTDPEGPAEILFSSTFYEACKRCLTDGGIFVAQNGVAFMQPQEVITSNQRLRSLFRDTSFYTASIPTYAGGQMMLAWASDNDTLRSLRTDVLTQRWRDTGIQSRYYTPQIHRAAFALPQYVLDMLG